METSKTTEVGVYAARDSVKRCSAAVHGPRTVRVHTADVMMQTLVPIAMVTLLLVESAFVYHSKNQWPQK